jgi:hypothetical protein
MHADLEPPTPRRSPRSSRTRTRGVAPAATACALAALACLALAAREGATEAAAGSTDATANLSNDAIASPPSREAGSPAWPDACSEAAAAASNASGHSPRRAEGPAASSAPGPGKSRYIDLAEPRPIDADRPNLLPGWEGHSCAKCHADVAREWATSTHAMAWIDPRYQEALADMKRPEACHNCHIPEPLHLQAADGKPPQKPATRPLSSNAVDAVRRDSDAHYGVSCATCHEGKDGAMLGPRGGPTVAHPTAKDDSFTDAGADRLCISCHATSVGPVVGVAKDFVDSRQREAHGLSCVGCHMQPLERPIAAEEGKPSYPTRSTRSHALQTPRDPAFAARAFAIAVQPQGAGGFLVALANTTGHRVPGLVGREFLVDAILRDASGAELAREELVVDRSSAILADGAARLELPAKPGAREVLVVVRHLGPGMEDPIEVKRETIRLP